jgi:hypothetical protein
MFCELHERFLRREGELTTNELPGLAEVSAFLAVQVVIVHHVLTFAYVIDITRMASVNPKFQVSTNPVGESSTKFLLTRASNARRSP